MHRAKEVLAVLCECGVRSFLKRYTPVVRRILGSSVWLLMSRSMARGLSHHVNSSSMWPIILQGAFGPSVMLLRE
jgi:hypothetical protein